MKGKSYLSLGGVSMGIAGSIVDHNFFEYLAGNEVQAVDMTELRRRIDQKDYRRKFNWKWHWPGLIKTSAMAKMKITNSINAMPDKAAQFCAKVY
ncbi:hypothetical protein ACLK2F_15785 [Escherichia coli]